MPLVVPVPLALTEGKSIVLNDATPKSYGVMTPAQAALLAGYPFPNTPKSLSNGVAVSLFTVDMTVVNDNSFGAIVDASIEATDGTDYQVRTGSLYGNLILKGGVYTTSQSFVLPITSLSAGSLTTTFSWLTSGTLATLQITSTSSLSVTDMHINYFMRFTNHVNAVALA